MPGGYEWMLILLVVLLFFGKRIPGVARSLGSGISEFKAGLREGNEEARKKIDSDADAAAAAKKDQTGS
ncbi:MAG: twin-arginine translocase TatA/TatE family subunit [Planctomycetes bacterium]|nr:twin-arginine translocase TatA/TatE family subunit [Planctomycetota bacterium]